MGLYLPTDKAVREKRKIKAAERRDVMAGGGL
jgi:hypothetical protein